jgi:hypothetical protein
MDPAPLVTLMMRAVLVDFFSSSANAATVMAGPMVLVRSAALSCSAVDLLLGAWEIVSSYSPEMAALLTRASRLLRYI